MLDEILRVADAVKTLEGNGVIEKIEGGYALVRLEAGHLVRTELDRISKLVGAIKKDILGEFTQAVDMAAAPTANPDASSPQ